MKKLVLLLCLVLIFTCACTKKNGDKAEVTEEPIRTQQPTQTPPAEDATDDETETDTSETVEPTEEPAEETEEPEVQYQTGTGKYVGQIDNNSIEIEVNGLPKEEAARAFMLSEEVRASFEALNLDTSEGVTFEFYVNANGQSIVTKIDRISN